MAEPVLTAAQVWEPTHPRAVPELLAGLTCPWWIAGGWALDLFMGRESRPQGASRWVLELLLEDGDGDAWVFRRRRAIRRPLAAAIRFDRTRIPYLAPEIQLLYKAQRPRPEDDADFGNVAPRLDEGGRSFLHDALAGIDPHHPWLEVLAAPRGKECA